MNERMTKDLVLAALRMALGRRQVDGESGLLHHSDRGSQYASEAYQELLRAENITCSKQVQSTKYESPTAHFQQCVRVSYFVLRSSYFIARAEARTSVFDYIERFYNRLRRHSALGYLSPEQYEEAA